MEKRKKISLWLLLFSLAQTPLATASADAHSAKKKAHTHQTSKKVEKKSAKKSKKKNHSVVSKTTHKHKQLSGKQTDRKEETSEGQTIQSGRACIYSNSLHGSATATGERFNKNALTAAHLHLPLGARVRVTSVETGKSVVVRINDRGPYAKKFILDMSPAAAQKIGLNFTKGTMAVKIQKLGKEGKEKKVIAEDEEVLAAE